ncbi:S10 family peptidase [Rahnella variigena]|uniref:S10 family peptidase n=1 Tax=Rahnella variigena TaxID=574964 RepID=UPI001C6FE91E|nr:hypothetical protein [Rahnella variigena]
MQMPLPNFPIRHSFIAIRSRAISGRLRLQPINTDINNMKRILIGFLSAVSLFIGSVTAADNQQNATLVEHSPRASQTIDTEGSVTVNQVKINYQAQTGVLELNNEDPEDPVIGMFYVAYFKKQENKPANRPITFIYNGGPGSASLWLHMGALGPKRVIATQPGKTQLAPYSLTNNQYSLLNVSDLVFIDAPGTGYSRFLSTATSQQERAQQKSQSANNVYGVNGDAQAFSQFIVQFLTDYQRWNSPKYLLGESYGTTRTVVLAEELKNLNIDLNGIILISQILNHDNNVDDPDLNPGVDQPYYLALPTYAASAWYHHTLPNKDQDLRTLLAEAERFALGPYALALQQGNNLPENDRQTTADQLYQFTGISADYWLKADLRLKGPVFSKKLLSSLNETIGRMDTRYHGSSLDNLGASASYDPNVSVLTSAYVAQFHDYLVKTLKYRSGQNYLAFSDAIHTWDMSGNSKERSFNVLPNLAGVMKTNPSMRIMVMGGIYDMATPYFAAKYEMSHLPVSAKLHNNMVFYWYDSGHMPYVDELSLKMMHADLSAFIF